VEGGGRGAFFFTSTCEVGGKGKRRVPRLLLLPHFLRWYGEKAQLEEGEREESSPAVRGREVV